MVSTIRADLEANAPGSQHLRDWIYAALFAHGFQAVLWWRAAAYLFARGGVLRLLARFLSYWHAIYFGVHISLEAKIGPGFALPHPIGVSIGRKVVLGASVSVYQNVSIGRAGAAPEDYPTLGDRVTIYPGAVVAGRLELGDGAVVGPNAVVTRSLGPGETAFAEPARQALLRDVAMK